MSGMELFSNEPGVVSGVVQDLVHGLLNQETVIFCGAGISLNSGLPSVGQLVPELLDKLGVAPKERKHIQDPVTGKLRLSFEAFMDMVGKNTPLKPLLDIYTQGEPNATHVFIAKLMRQGRVNTVVTTNLDLLLERALEQEGAAYDLVHAEALHESLGKSRPRPRLVKFSGGVSARDALGLPLAADDAQSAQRTAVLRQVFTAPNAKTILVLGYGGADLSELFAQIPPLLGSDKKIVYIDHIARTHAPRVTLRSARPSGVRRTPAAKHAITHLSCCTDDLVRALWLRTLHEPCRESAGASKTKPSWKKQVQAWSLALTPGSKASLLGMLLFALAAYPEAAYHWERARVLARRAHDPRQEGRALGHLGSAQWQLGSTHQARMHFKKALGLAHRTGDLLSEGIWLGEAGQACVALGRSYKGMRYLERALELAWQCGDLLAEKTWLGKLGLLHSGLHDHLKAHACFSDARDLARRTGDRAGEGTYLGYMGTSHCCLGEYAQAVKEYQEALQISQDLGEQEVEASLLTHLGMAHRQLHQPAKAIAFFEQSLRCSQRIGDVRGEGLAYGQLGISYHERGDARAAGYYRKAIKILHELNEAVTPTSPRTSRGIPRCLPASAQLTPHSPAQSALSPVLDANCLDIACMETNRALAELGRGKTRPKG